MTSIKFRALTHDDHKLFFEALGEYGKDFQNIQQYMSQKGGKSGGKSSDQNKSLDLHEKREQDIKKEDDKKREQIRNFYNKLYTKISQLLDYKIDDRVEKVIQELYLLINYGEIWKKHGFKFNDKTKKLLKELVIQGSTTYRSKNKNVRLRTPPCKALKKINEIGVDEKVKVVTARELPKDVIVEFHPATNRDWLKVQSIAQNPRVRAKLSIQKRLSNILDFLESKWNISHDKLNRTVDVWLKVQPSIQNIDDLQPQPNLQPNTNCSSSVVNNSTSNKNTFLTNGIAECPEQQQDIQPNNNNISNPAGDNNGRSMANNNVHYRLRLKPSAQHELNEVNITRVIPDNHLDLSLNAFISRLGETKQKMSQLSASTMDKNQEKHNREDLPPGSCNGGELHAALSGHFEYSQGALSTNSRLPISLTTPDSSIFLERSCTSDQPSIAQARKHLNLLQSLTGSLENCENSRMACEDTQDRSLMNILHSNNHSDEYNHHHHSLNETNSKQTGNPTIVISHDIEALYDEDAALPVSSAQETTSVANENPSYHLTSQPNSDSQNSKSVDFHIPKNVTLGDYFKMAGGDEANDAFPTNSDDGGTLNGSNDVEIELSNNKDSPETDIQKTSPHKYGNMSNNNQSKANNHMIEITKFAEGWTRQDSPLITIGELYLAFKCPEKIILEYEFEQFVYDNQSQSAVIEVSTENLTSNYDQTSIQQNCTKTIQEIPSNNALIFKLLTAASLSLAHIARQKQEQQHKLHDQQTCSKFKRRKGPGQSHAMTLHDIEATNQRVEEALKQLQPTRLSSHRRAR